MNHALAFLILVLLPSCSLMHGDPTFRKPQRKDLAGSYHVAKISLLASNRKELKKAVIKIAPDGSFQLDNPAGNVRSPLIPKRSGNWDLTETSGIDIASGMSWAVRFSSTDGSRLTAYCLNKTSPYKLMFFDRSKRGDFGDSLILIEDEQVGGENSLKPHR